MRLSALRDAFRSLLRFVWSALLFHVAEYRRRMRQRDAFDEIWLYACQYDIAYVPETVEAPLPTLRIQVTPNLVVFQETRPQGACYKLVTLNIEAVWIFPSDALHKDAAMLWARLMSPQLYRYCQTR